MNKTYRYCFVIIIICALLLLLSLPLKASNEGDYGDFAECYSCSNKYYIFSWAFAN